MVHVPEEIFLGLCQGNVGHVVGMMDMGHAVGTMGTGHAVGMMGTDRVAGMLDMMVGNLGMTGKKDTTALGLVGMKSTSPHIERCNNIHATDTQKVF